MDIDLISSLFFCQIGHLDPPYVERKPRFMRWLKKILKGLSNSTSNELFPRVGDEDNMFRRGPTRYPVIKTEVNNSSPVGLHLGFSSFPCCSVRFLLRVARMNELGLRTRIWIVPLHFPLLTKMLVDQMVRLIV